MELDSAINQRKSVRSFKNKNVSWKIVLEAIDSATKAPYAGNINNLRFLIVEDKESKEKVAEFCNQQWINDAGIILIACSEETHLENLYGERGRIYSRQHAGAALENLLLKITDLGLSACWIGAFTDELVRQWFKIPKHVQIEAIIPIGYEKEHSEKPRKKKLESVIYWEKWGTDKKAPPFKDPSTFAKT